MNIKRIILPLIFLIASAATAEVVRIDVERTSDVADGKSYGLAGPYESIAGRIHYAVDPQNSVNRTWDRHMWNYDWDDPYID